MPERKKAAGVADQDFTWVDGERLIRYGARRTRRGARACSRAAASANYALLTTERARGSRRPAVVRGGGRWSLHVPPGPVPEAAAAVRSGVDGRPLVALGGGRVIDSAKAIAGADGLRGRRDPDHALGRRDDAASTACRRASTSGASCGPSLVIAAPGLMASQPMPELAASAMNALAHAVEALYTPLANPVAEHGRAARRRADRGGSPTRASRGRPTLALGALLAGYASGIAGLRGPPRRLPDDRAVCRHAPCPDQRHHAAALRRDDGAAAPASDRAPGRRARCGRAQAGPRAEAVERLSRRCGGRQLSEYGVEKDDLPGIAAAVQRHPALQNTPDPPSEGECWACSSARSDAGAGRPGIVAVRSGHDEGTSLHPQRRASNHEGGGSEATILSENGRLAIVDPDRRGHQQRDLHDPGGWHRGWSASPSCQGEQRARTGARREPNRFLNPAPRPVAGPHATPRARERDL